MPLRLRLALLFAAGTVLVIAVAGVAFLVQLRVSVDTSLDNGLRSRAAAVVGELSVDGEAPTHVAQAEQITQILTPIGQLLASSAAAGDAPLLDPAQRAQALGGEVTFIATVGGARNRLLATTADVGGHPMLVVVGTGTDVSDAAVERLRSALLLGGPPAVLLAGFGAWLLARAALGPVERMRRQAAAISEHDSGTQLAVPDTRDEIAALGATINALLERLQSALARERSFVADAGHELRTPLAILRTELELAARPGRSREDLAEAIRHAGEETDRLIRLAEDLLLLARADNNQPFLRPVRLQLPAVLTAAARGAQARAAARGVSVEVDGPTDLGIRADVDRLRQAVDNLLDNAIRYAPPGSVVELRAATEPTAGDGSMVTIEVADRGPGFTAEFLPHAFERFQRADAARSRDGGGTGLGLAIVRAVAVAHGGEVTARHRPDGGAVVTVELPADIAQPPHGQPDQPSRNEHYPDCWVEGRRTEVLRIPDLT